jgi:hypothetical protein
MGWGREEKREKHFLFPTQEMVAKTLWWFPTLSFIVES